MAVMNPITLPPPGESAYGLKGFALDYTGADAGIDAVVVHFEIDLDVDADVGFDARRRIGTGTMTVTISGSGTTCGTGSITVARTATVSAPTVSAAALPAREQLDLSMLQSATGRCHR